MSIAQTPPPPFDIHAYLRGKPHLTKRLAHELDLFSQTIHCWKAVPVRYLPVVSRVLGIPPADLRPDFAYLFREGAAGGAFGISDDGYPPHQAAKAA